LRGSEGDHSHPDGGGDMERMPTRVDAPSSPVSRLVGDAREPYADFAFLTVEEVKELMGGLGVNVSLCTIRRLVREGRLPRFPGRLKPAAGRAGGGS
jgi:hypothetical protein